MHFILHKDGFPTHFASHTASHLPPFFLTGTTRLSTENGTEAGAARALRLANSAHGTKAATTRTDIKQFMRSLSTQRTHHSCTVNMPTLRDCSNGLRGAAITFGGSW